MRPTKKLEWNGVKRPSADEKDVVNGVAVSSPFPLRSIGGNAVDDGCMKKNTGGRVYPQVPRNAQSAKKWVLVLEPRTLGDPPR